MKIVIVGAGKIGYSLAEELANENHDITVVDIEKEKVKLLSDTLDVMTLCGNGAAISVQREANVDESDLHGAGRAEHACVHRSAQARLQKHHRARA